MRNVPPVARSIAVSSPLYGQVRELILSRINQGTWSAGEALPNELQLSNEFGVSIGTVRRAILGLEDAGIVVRKQGRGTYLAGQGRQALSEKFCPIRNADGTRPILTYRLEHIGQRPATMDESSTLRCATGSQVFQIEQTIMVDAVIVGCENAILPALRFPKLETQLLFGQDLYPIYGDYGFLVTQATDSLLTVAATSEYAQRLAVSVGGALLRVNRTTRTLDGQYIESRTAWYVTEHIRYTVDIH
jgi:GntR family transcriptional regulator